MVKDCAMYIKSVLALVPEDQYWRWSHMWSHPLRSATFAAVLIEYLSNENLLSQAGVAKALGSKWNGSYGEYTLNFSKLKMKKPENS